MFIPGELPQTSSGVHHSVPIDFYDWLMGQDRSLKGQSLRLQTRKGVTEFPCGCPPDKEFDSGGNHYVEIYENGHVRHPACQRLLYDFSRTYETPVVVIGVHELRTVVKAVLEQRGFSEYHGMIIARSLVDAELRGNSQGLVKLADIQPTRTTGEIEFTRETATSALVHGHSHNAMVVVQEACRHAVDIAKRNGTVAVVGVNHTSTSSGRLGFFTSWVAEEYDLCALLFATTRPVVAALGGKHRVVGTNPIALSVPTGNRRSITHDFTTAATAWYAVAAAAQSGQSLAEGIALDENGAPTTDAQAALGGALLPRAGAFGWGLSVITQLMAGPLVQAFASPTETDNWGHLLLVMNPRMFTDSFVEFQSTVSRMVGALKSDAQGRQSVGSDRIYLPGERGDERARYTGYVALDRAFYHKLMEELKNRQ